MNTQVKDVGMVILAIVIIVSVFMGMQRADKYMQIRAMSDCSKVTSYVYETRNGEEVTRTTEPNRAFYKTCMEDMGYKTNIKE